MSRSLRYAPLACTARRYSLCELGSAGPCPLRARHRRRVKSEYHSGRAFRHETPRVSVKNPYPYWHAFANHTPHYVKHSILSTKPSRTRGQANAAGRVPQPPATPPSSTLYANPALGSSEGSYGGMLVCHTTSKVSSPITSTDLGPI